MWAHRLDVYVKPTHGPPLARAKGAASRARGPPVDDVDKPQTAEWYIFAPPRRYIISAPLTIGNIVSLPKLRGFASMHSFD
jgi:hypothetical protein